MSQGNQCPVVASVANRMCSPLSTNGGNQHTVSQLQTFQRTRMHKEAEESLDKQLNVCMNTDAHPQTHSDIHTQVCSLTHTQRKCPQNNCTQKTHAHAYMYMHAYTNTLIYIDLYANKPALTHAHKQPASEKHLGDRVHARSHAYRSTHHHSGNTLDTTIVTRFWKVAPLHWLSEALPQLRNNFFFLIGVVESRQRPARLIERGQVGARCF